MDKEIVDCLEKNIKEITTPVCAFITFTTQEAYERCCKYLFKKDEVGHKNEDYRKIKLFAQETTVEEATDPSNIVWEDLGITGKELFWNNIKANTIMTLLVLGGFFFFWFLRYIPNRV